MIETKNLKLLIVDDHEFTRLGLATGIQRKSKIDILGEAADGEEAVKLTAKLHPNVILMDIGMPKMDGITATRLIKSKHPEIKVVILSSRQVEEEVQASLSAGADGYCLKDISTERLIHVLELVSEGGVWLDPDIAKILANSLSNNSKPIEKKASLPYSSVDLTEREQEVLDLIVQGKSNKDISEALGISLPTTKGHVSNLIQKLAVDDRTQAALKAVKEGLSRNSN